jgi:two-component system, NtrC family, nitrogen regulation response regulator NtrX
MAESILIVDDEESVRRTFLDWLTNSDLGCDAHAVADAEAALVFANQGPIDLAILDWNLGSGSDGLQLLEDLVEFHPDIVAILVTGFAHQATPLDALRMGVRDYLDKNQDLNRDTFLAAVKRQLDRIVPAKRQRQFTRSLLAFREAVEKVLPLVQSSAAMNDRVPLPDTIRNLILFLMRTTQATDGVLIARHVPADGPEVFCAFGSDGMPLDPLTAPFERSLAASVVSMQEPCALNLRDSSLAESVEFQPFEKGHRHLLAAPIQVAAATLVVIELFDKHNGQPFSDEDRRHMATATDFGAELLRRALSERQTQRTLFNAVEAALHASDSLAAGATAEPEAPPPPAVLDRLKEGLSKSGNSLMDADTSLRLAEGIRVLALRHGPAAVKHCVEMVDGLRRLLDEMTGG